METRDNYLLGLDKDIKEMLDAARLRPGEFRVELIIVSADVYNDLLFDRDPDKYKNKDQVYTETDLLAYKESILDSLSGSANGFQKTYNHNISVIRPYEVEDCLDKFLLKSTDVYIKKEDVIAIQDSVALLKRRDLVQDV